MTAICQQDKVIDAAWQCLSLASVEGAQGKLLRLQNMCAMSMCGLQALESSLIKKRMSRTVCMLSCSNW